PLVTPTAVSVHRRLIRLLLDGSGFDFERRCWPPGKLTRANDDSNPYDGRQQIPYRSRPGRGTAQMVVSKKCKSNHPSASNVTSQTGDQWAADAYRAWHPSAREAAMKRCAQCHGRLGLGVRSRNLWNGRWWAHARFCSVNTSWSVTTLTLNNIAGTPSSILAVRRADVFARDGDTGG